jgi:hypothetical protein
MKVYHVDRHGNCEPGTALQLQYQTEVPQTFSRGVSKFGYAILNTVPAENPEDYDRETASNHLTYFREIIFELERRSNFPDQPSRLQSLFAVGSVEEAREYRDELSSNAQIYEIEPKEPAGPFNMGGLSGRNAVEMLQCAREYWMRGPIPDQATSEYLLQFPVEIGSRVES